MTPTIVIDMTDLATNDLQRVAARSNDPELRESVAQAATEEVREFYTRLDRERPNAMGGRRLHFFAQAAESAVWRDLGDSVEVDVPEPLGLRQRILGGAIVPGKGVSAVTGQPPKYLTIAASAASYGHRAGEYDNLVPLFRRRDGQVEAFALAEAPAQAVRFNEGKVVKGRKTGGRSQVKLGGATFQQAPTVLFWLVKAVNQDPDPTAAPDEQQVVAAGKAGAARFFASLVGNIGGVE